MKTETKKIIRQIAEVIDRDKFNPILTSKGYVDYLEKVLTQLVISSISLEGIKNER